jgi:hypothetical protein
MFKQNKTVSVQKYREPCQALKLLQRRMEMCSVLCHKITCDQTPPEAKEGFNRNPRKYGVLLNIEANKGND